MNQQNQPVLRINLIIMRIQIRTLDPYWGKNEFNFFMLKLLWIQTKKMDPDPDPGHEHFLKFC